MCPLSGRDGDARLIGFSPTPLPPTIQPLVCWCPHIVPPTDGMPPHRTPCILARPQQCGSIAPWLLLQCYFQVTHLTGPTQEVGTIVCFSHSSHVVLGGGHFGTLFKSGFLRLGWAVLWQDPPPGAEGAGPKYYHFKDVRSKSTSRGTSTTNPGKS